ncbi:MAG: DUF1810 domain-containing protein [Verrucomicrobiota bacterium]|nr:DUF1810 domain-containing protein [Verrucomicrobiota bacterium]
MSLRRFHEAQESRFGGYETALAEIRGGAKRSHWIWYIFPQLQGLGRSSAAQAYAIRDFSEACEYLRDPTLRARYAEIAAAVQEQLAAGVELRELMGSSIDALKLVSSVTLFRAAAESFGHNDVALRSLAITCAAIRDQASLQGFPPCQKTLAELAG